MNASGKKQRCPDFAAILRRSPPDEPLREQIILCFADQMKRVARHRCRSDALADDAFQESVALMLAALPGYRGDGPVKHWLRRLVLTACSRIRRGRGNDPAINLPLSELAEEHEALVEQQRQDLALLLHERVALLHEALAELAEPNRSLLLLHEGQDLPLQELARRFDLTIEGVKSRLKRTRCAMRQRLLALAGEPA